MVFALASPVVAAFGQKKVAPKKTAAPKKKPLGAKKAAPKRSAGVKRQGNVGPNRTLWNGFDTTPEAPAYLDGTLPGDAGFDPLGLSKPVEYLQFGLDSLNQSGAINPSGNIIGKLKKVDNKPTERTIVVSNGENTARNKTPPTKKNSVQICSSLRGQGQGAGARCVARAGLRRGGMGCSGAVSRREEATLAELGGDATPGRGEIWQSDNYFGRIGGYPRAELANAKRDAGFFWFSFSYRRALPELAGGDRHDTLVQGRR
jgi:hypothetical protein